MPTPPDPRRQRQDDAYASAPDTVEALLDLLPDLAAEVARKDVLARAHGGTWSDEQDRLFGLVRALRDRLRAAEGAALNALKACGADTSDALRWLRSTDPGLPRFQRPDADDGYVTYPYFRSAADAFAFVEHARRGADPAPASADLAADPVAHPAAAATDPPDAHRPRKGRR